MATFNHPVSIVWGPAPAPVSVRAVGATAHALTLTSPIAQDVATGVYSAVATFDTAWGPCRDYWVGADGQAYPGDGPLAADVHFANGEPLVPDSAGGGIGSGDTSIDHDGASGVTVNGAPSETDIMRVIAVGGEPIDDAEVTAYLADDYDAGRKGPAYRQAFVRTGSDGRWVQAMHLDAGDYTFEVTAEGYDVITFDVAVP